MVAGKFGNDWYRCKIERHNMKSGVFTVNFIDYGNPAELKAPQLQKLPEAIKKLPRLARKVQLAMLLSPSSKDGMNLFHVAGRALGLYVQDKKVTIKVLRQQGGPLEVEVSAGAGKSVNEQ